MRNATVGCSVAANSAPRAETGDRFGANPLLWRSPLPRTRTPHPDGNLVRRSLALTYACYSNCVRIDQVSAPHIYVELDTFLRTRLGQ